MLWHVLYTGEAWLVQTAEPCQVCRRHKAIAWVGGEFPDGWERAKSHMDQANAERLDPASQVDMRPDERARCEHGRVGYPAGRGHPGGT